jgi:hypothetical protein
MPGESFEDRRNRAYKVCRLYNYHRIRTLECDWLVLFRGPSRLESICHLQFHLLMPELRICQSTCGACYHYVDASCFAILLCQCFAVRLVNALLLALLFACFSRMLEKHGSIVVEVACKVGKVTRHSIHQATLLFYFYQITPVYPFVFLLPDSIPE